jgi:hypothetical protein
MRARTIFTAAAFFAQASSALACPVCETDTGQQVREGIFNSDFGGTLAAMVLPFLVLASVVAVIHGGTPARTQRLGGERRPTDSR